MRPTRREEVAVIRAVTYASLFDYPLTVAQLRDTLEVRVDEATLAQWLTHGPQLRRAVCLKDDFVSPSTRPDLVARRIAREASSRTRLRLDAPVLKAIGALPFVRMVAISGSLAHLNGEDGADLDLFVVTAPSRVWSVTVVALMLTRAMGWRSRLCLNYVVSQAAMAVHPADLFAANQIIHLQPVMGDATYHAFLNANSFAGSRYPNFQPRPLLDSIGVPRRRLARAIEWVLAPVAPILERTARALYTWHLRRRSQWWHSPEQVQLEAECLKLHTNSHRGSILARFEASLGEALSDARDTGGRRVAG